MGFQIGFHDVKMVGFSQILELLRIEKLMNLNQYLKLLILIQILSIKTKIIS